MSGIGARRGGVAILAAFLLLSLMAAAAFATGRNLMRELAICADAVQGARAAAAAEAGLAWFLAQPPMAPEVHAIRDVPGVDPGEAFRQRFQLRVRFLGLLPAPAGDPGEPAEGLWQVTSRGHCGVEGRGDFIQVRELLVADARAPDRPGALRILAWRTVAPDAGSPWK